MRRIPVLLALLLAATGVVAGQARPAVAAPASTVRLPALERAILVRLNATRASRGLRPLVLSRGLQEAAVFHSRSMLEGGFFAHESGNGSPFGVRVRRFYRASGYDAWSAGENLLYGTAEITPAGAIKAWLQSPPHRDNLLSPRWREVGIGSLHAAIAGGTFGGRPTWVITMDFGARTGGPEAVKQAAVRKAVGPGIAATTGTKDVTSPTPTRLVKRRIDRVLPLPAGAL